MNTKNLEQSLSEHFNSLSYENFFHEKYLYSLLPAGKLFRPKLVYAISIDKNEGLFSEDHQILASLVEIHHTYTLMHDDLPAMDDDDQRRGRPSSHKKFGEWQALLAGDGLLNSSYALMAKVKHERLRELLSYVSWCLGPKGLILGQAMDLSGEMNKSFENICLTHKLKTARLIQASLVGSLILCEKNFELKDYKSLHKFGEHLGLLFQFLDDLTELSESNLSSHEQEVNPWPKQFEKCFEQVKRSTTYINHYFKMSDHKNLEEIVKSYFEKTKTSLRKSSLQIENHINKKLDPTIALLD